MFRRIGIAVAMTAMLGVSQASAQSFSESQRNAMENIAQAFAGTARCSRYAVNPKMVVLIQLRFGVSMTNPVFSKYIEERALFHRNRIAGRTEQDLCEAVGRLYGPGGSSMADLVVAK